MMNTLFQQNLVFTTHGKKKSKILTKTKNLKHQLRHGMTSLNYLMACILYKIISVISSKKHERVIDDLPIRIYVNKTENRITFKIKQLIISNF